MKTHQPDISILEYCIGIPIIGLIIAIAVIVDVASGTNHLSELRQSKDYRS